MANVVEVTVRGNDELSRIFRDVQSTADRAFSNVESAIESVPDLDVDVNVDTGRAVRNLSNVEGAVGEAEGAIRSMPDPQINGSRARAELEGIGDAAEDAQKKIEGIDLQSALGGLAAGGGIAAAVDKALNFENLNTKIDITFDVPPKSIAAVRDSVNTVQSYGVDAEAALEGVRRQFALNADASDEANQRVIKGAGAIASAYGDIDFTELIQEVNEIGSELNISDDEALGLANSLLKVGFPPDQIDIISEYGKQLTDAGYSAEEVQAIMQAGVETGTWNIDNLLDGLKEGRIRLAEFGAGVDETTANMLKGTGISTKQLQKWGKAVASGGDEGKQAMQEVAKALDGIDNQTLKNQLGVQLFGTMYEDQGQNIIDTLLNADDATVSLEEGQKGVNEAIAAMDADPAVQMQQAMHNMNMAMAPLLTNIANVVANIATWVSENPKLAGTIAAIATAIGIITGAFMALGPVVTGVKIALSLFNTTLLASPVTWVIVGIMALIAAIILLWQNWDSVSQWLSASWNWIKGVASIVFNAIASGISAAWEWIKTATTTVWEGIKSFFLVIWEGIKSVFTTVVTAIQTALSAAWNFISTVIYTVWNGIKAFFGLVWQGIVTVVTTYINIVRTVITTVFNVIKTIITTIWNGIKAFFGLVWKGIVTVVTTYINIVRTVITTVFNVIKTIITTIWNAIKTVTSTVWNTIVSVVNGLINRLKNTISTIFNAIKTVITTIWNTVKSISSSVWNTIVSVVTGIINRLRSSISNVFHTIRSIISTVWNTVRSVSSNVWNGIRSTISGIVNGIRSTISNVFNSIKSKIIGVWNGVKSATSRIWSGIVSSVKSPINSIIRMVNGMINSLNSINIRIPKIPKWVPGIGGKGGQTIGFNIPNVPALATGGVVNEPTLAIVGDAGRSNPEIVAPQKMISSIVGQELSKALGRVKPVPAGGSGTITIEVPIYLEGREIARATAPYMDRELGTIRHNKTRAEGG